MRLHVPVWYQPAQHLKPLLQLMRVDKPLCAGLLTLLGAYLAVPVSALWSLRLAVAACVVALLTAFGFVINDCCDVVVDGIGKPDRPLPSGRISRRAAKVFAWSLALAGWLLSCWLGARPAMFALGAIALSAAYSFKLKGTLLMGNASVAALVASTILFGADVVGQVPLAAVVAASITFLYIMAQEVLFNMEDEGEDRAAGLTTTATQLGMVRSARMLRGMWWALLLPAVAVPWGLRMAPTAYFVTLMFCSVAPIGLMLRMLRSPVSEVGVRRAARLSRWVWLTSFVPLALLKGPM